MKPHFPKIILTSLILLTCILGVIGFSSVFPEFGFLTWLYMTMQLFLLDPQSFDVSDVISGSKAGNTGVPLTLELARWMAAGITCYGIIFALWKLLQKSTGALKIQKLKNHLILFGSGPMVAEFLKDAREKNISCLLLTTCPSLLDNWRSRGGLAVEIIEGSDQAGITKNHLVQSGLTRAFAFYAFDTADSENLRAAMLAENLSTEAKIIVRQDEPFACDLLQRNGLLSPGKGSLLRVFSAAYTRARVLLRETPLEWHPQHGLASEVHLVIPSLGMFEKAVAIQAALIGHYSEGKQVNLWLTSASSHSQLGSDFPGISKCLNLHVMGENGIHSIADISREAPPNSLVTIMATHVQPEEGYLQALHHRESWSAENNFRIILRGPLADDDTLIACVDDVAVAPQLSGLASPDALDEYDLVAANIHNTWHEGNQRRIDNALSEGENQKAAQLKSKPTFKNWSKLTEEQKDVNRTAADHIEIKIRAAGLSPTQPDLIEAWDRLTTEQLDMLSRMEHERWAAPLWINGYKPGERDEVKRTHPDLIPFDDLDQSTKDYDTEQVRMAAKYYSDARKGK